MQVSIAKRWLPWPRRRLERHELAWLLGALAICTLVYAFIALAGDVMEGDTRAIDTSILRAFRQANDPSMPIGPAWLETAALDVTALGGPTVIWLVVAGWLSPPSSVFFVSRRDIGPPF
jgi:hypothetical protein